MMPEISEDGTVDPSTGIWLTVTVDKKPRLVKVIAYEPSDGGGPRKVLTEDGAEYIRRMARRGCVLKDIAAEMGINEQTLYAPHNRERTKEAYSKGVSECDNRLRAAQVSRALDGNATMLVWLGKVRLGQRDESSVEVVVRDKTNVTFDELDGMFGDEDDTLQGDRGRGQGAVRRVQIRPA